MCCENLMYKLPQLEYCCCCCKVETGSNVIGWLELVGASIYSVTYTAAFVLYAMGDKPLDNPDDTKAVIVLLITMLVIMVFMWAMAIVLLVGLYKDNMRMVKMWLRVSICLLIFGLVIRGLSIITVIISGRFDGIDMAVNVIYAIIRALIAIYFLAVVKSHYMNKTQVIQADREPEGETLQSI